MFVEKFILTRLGVSWKDFFECVLFVCGALTQAKVSEYLPHTPWLI